MNKGKNRGGQSLVELVVGLLAIVLVLMGLLQIGRLSLEHTQVLMDAREAVDAAAMNESFVVLDPGPAYALSVDRGSDRRSYSQDDRVVAGAPDLIVDEVVTHARPADLALWMGDSAIGPLVNSEHFMDAFDFVSEQRSSDVIELYPIIRNLVTEDDRIRMERRVWMPWLRGLR